MKYVTLSPSGPLKSVDPTICSHCLYEGAIKWNKFNMVVQCHNCGHVPEVFKCLICNKTFSWYDREDHNKSCWGE